MGRRAGVGLAVAMVLTFAGCAPKDEPHAATLPPPEVTISEVVVREVTDYAQFTGRTAAVKSVDVRARVTGYLTKIDFTDGQEVQEGDLLFEIDPRPFDALLKNAEGMKAQWEAKLARAKADVARYEKLVPTGAATPQDLDKAVADEGEAVAAIQSAQAAIDRAALDLEFARITAPLSGQISRAQIREGNLVRSDNELLTTIVSLDPIHVYFDVSERDLLAFQARARAAASGGKPSDLRTARIPAEVGLASESGFSHRGELDFAENRVNPDTGTIEVRAVLDNAQRIFKPGLFTRVRVPVSDPYQAVLVAERAIGIDQGMKYVLVVNSENIVEQRFVEPGRLQDDGLRVVDKGLKAGELIVVNGLQRARPGKPVAPTRAEMPKRSGEVQPEVTATKPAETKPAADTKAAD